MFSSQLYSFLSLPEVSNYYQGLTMSISSDLVHFYNYVVFHDKNLSQFISPPTDGCWVVAIGFFLLYLVFQWTVSISLCICVRDFLGHGFPNFLSVKTKTEKDFCMALCGKQMRSKWQGFWLTQPNCHPEGRKSHYLSTPVISCRISSVEKFFSRALSFKLFNVYMNHHVILLSCRF